MPHLAGGRLRAVAVSTTRRLPALPDTPTMAETVPGYEIVSWDGLFAPKGTPPNRLDRLHDAVGAVLADVELVKSMRGRGYMPAEMPRKDFAEFVRTEHARMGGLVRKMGISLD